MTLDLEQVARHLPEIVRTLQAEHEARDARFDAALAALRSAAADLEAFKARLSAARTERTLTMPFHDSPADVRSVTAASEYAVLGVDGSHIQPQRDSPVPCSVMNFGWCRLAYREGEPPDLRAETQVDIASAGRETDEEREFFFSADALGVTRSVGEIEAAARLVDQLPPDLPALVLLDGSLAPWSLNRLQRRSGRRQNLLDRLFRAFDDLRSWASAAPERAVVAYTSFPAHREVVDSLNEARADGEPELAIKMDRSLFAPLLDVHQRSARFLMYSKLQGWIEQEFADAGHAIAYIYLRAESEVARVEMPEWIAAEERRVDFLHSALVDQLDRGLGYPLALMEAHERAVINGADRQAFSLLVEAALEAAGLASYGSAKNLSKRGRWLA